jgi:L-lactate dehydrogenase complex protein LldE
MDSGARVKVSLFITCMADQLVPAVGLSTVRLLQQQGCEVAFPALQTCCGQPAWNSGHAHEARRVGSTLLDAFADAQYVVAPSGSCAGMVRQHFEAMFADAPRQAAAARELAAKIHDFSQFMVNVLGVRSLPGSFPHRVTFHPSCHGMRLLGMREEPVTLLRAIPDLQLVPLPLAEDCCGFGGTFSIKLASLATKIVDEKIDHVVSTGAHYLVGTDLGCILNIAGRMQRRGLDIEALHLAELLDRAVQAGEGAHA